MRWQGKKGFYWEVTPERRASVEREVERYLRQEGKLREMDEIDGSGFVNFLKIMRVKKLFLLVYMQLLHSQVASMPPFQPCPRLQVQVVTPDLCVNSCSVPGHSPTTT